MLFNFLFSVQFNPMSLNKIVLSLACCSTLYDQNHINVSSITRFTGVHEYWHVALRPLHLRCTYSVLGVYRNFFTRSPADDSYWASLSFSVVRMLYTLPHTPSSIITVLQNCSASLMDAKLVSDALGPVSCAYSVVWEFSALHSLSHTTGYLLLPIKHV